MTPELDLSASAGGGLLERDADLRQIEDALADARAGSGRLVVVEGPAGIGKSRLLTAACERAGAVQMRVLTARGTELERSYPFGVVRQASDRMARESDPGDRRRWLSGAARLAVPVFDPRAIEAADALDATYPRLHGLYWLLANLAADGPVLIGVDDAQWADAASVTFMRFLAPRLRKLPVALVLACRPASHDGEEPLARLLADQAATVIRPKELSGGAVEHWVREEIGEDAESEFVSACHQATGGNPFLVDQLVREIVAEQIPPTAAQAGRVSGLSPATVRTVVLVRLGRMPAAATNVARALAVLGDDSRYQDVASLVRSSDAEPAADGAVAAGVAALAAGGIVDAREGLRFTHPILQASVYEDLPAHARATAHLRAAQLLHERGAPADAVASHLLRCEPGVPPWAVDALRNAADGALAIGAPDLAVDHLRRALQEDNDDRVAGALLLDLGTAEARLGQPAGLDHLGSAIETDDREIKLRATLTLAKALMFSGQGGRAVDVLENGLQALGDQSEIATSLRIELLGASNASLTARARVQDLLGSPEDPGGVPTTPLDLRVVATMAYNAAVDDLDPERAAELAARAVASPALSHDPVTGGESLIMAGAALQAAERLEESEVLFRHALEESRRNGSALGVVASACMRSAARYRRGRLKAAAADVETVAELAGHVQGAEVLAGTVIAVALACALERGAPDDQLEALLTYSERAMDLDLLATGQVLIWRGAVLDALGRHEEALASLLQCDRPDSGWGGRCPALLQWRSAAVPVLLALGDGARASALALEELELARAFGTPRSLGMALRAAALASDDGRLELQQEAVAVLESGPSPLELARVLVDLGATLRRSGRRTEARAVLQRAHDLATEIDAVRIAGAARDEILRSGARLRRTAGGPEALTPSEQRVAELAVEGRTNKAIAQALFLSEKTIETHLGNVYRKLGVRSRRELPRSLGEKPHSYQ